MYILARADIGLGLQAAQSAHAAFQVSAEYPDMVEDWLKNPTIVLLSVDDETALMEWARRLDEEHVPYTLVQEPDLNNEATAIAVPPHEFGRYFANLPLQGKVPMAA